VHVTREQDFRTIIPALFPNINIWD
jgi:hypothetical protein